MEDIFILVGTFTNGEDFDAVVAILGWSVSLWLILILLLVFIWYWNATAKFGTFKELGIPGPRPYPGIGTMFAMTRCPSGMMGFLLDLKKKYKSQVIGLFRGRMPTMVLYDVDVIKQITVKDFNNFVNRSMLVDLGSPLNSMMTSLVDDQWRHVRHLVSSTYSGSKLRRMTAMINKCGQNLVKNLQVPAKTGQKFECKEYTGSFTMDVIASSAFSIDVDSQRDKNNVFVHMARKILIRNMYSFRFWIIFSFPYLVPYLQKLGFSIHPPDAINFFLDIVDKAMKDRIEHPDEAPTDFLQMMMSAKIDEDAKYDDSKPQIQNVADSSEQWSSSGLTRDDIVAQCILFFLAGYNTVADALTFVMFNLATHPGEQEKAYQEIITVLGDQEEPDYDMIKKMTYVQMCLEESMRIYPQAPMIDRVAKSETVINGIRIPKDMVVVIPVHAIHHDPDLWEEPEKFNPERFTAEAKKDRDPFQYLPFGLGPRACVAQRLAILEAKIAMVHMLKNFRLVTCDKTEIPIKFKKMRPEAEKGVWLKLESRT